MKGYTIQNSIDLLEKGGTGSGGSTTASNVSFDNTDTGIVSDNVQGAISEVNDNVKKGHVYSTTEHIVGKWIDNRDIYEKTISIGPLPNATTKEVDHNIDNLDYVISIIGSAKNPTSGGIIPLAFTHRTTIGEQIQTSVNANKVSIITAVDKSELTEAYVTLTYVKTSETTKKTRKTKKEE